jgi:hypothetical protein
VRNDVPYLGSGSNPDPKSVFKPLAMPTGDQTDDNLRKIFG